MQMMKASTFILLFAYTVHSLSVVSLSKRKHTNLYGTIRPFAFAKAKDPISFFPLLIIPNNEETIVFIMNE